MNGIEMMLKSMGIDPEKIRASLVDAQAQVMNEISKVHKLLESIDAKVTRIEIKLETIPTNEAMKLLADNEDVVVKELESLYGRGNNDGNRNNDN